jgi:ABC-2 type transport system ATP-binding protein
MSESTVTAEAIRYSYGSRSALENVEFSVERGTLFGLLGPNGSGKTTLFRLLSTLIPVQSGMLQVCGLDVSRSQSEVRRRLGVTFQSPAVDVRLTVRENLLCHGRIYGLSGRELNSRIHEMLDRFGLTDRTSTLVGELSGGLKRRVELAKGLMHNPQVLLLDEPTSGLDPRARQEFWELIVSQVKLQGTTVIVATHLMPEAEYCDQLLLLDKGRRVAYGSPSELQGRLSGERLTLRLRDATRISGLIEELLHCSGVLSANQLSLRVTNPAEQISRVMSQFGDQILGLELTRPSLEDVFLELTGRTLSASGDDHE